VVVRGSTSIREMNRAMAWDLPEEDAVTVAGLVIDAARRIPEPGEGFGVGGYEIEVLEREQTRLTKLKVRRSPPA
jgi:Mg2+/Co2+ transporter CorB